MSYLHQKLADTSSCFLTWMKDSFPYSALPELLVLSIITQDLIIPSKPGKTHLLATTTCPPVSYTGPLKALALWTQPCFMKHWQNKMVHMGPAIQDFQSIKENTIYYVLRISVWVTNTCKEPLFPMRESLLGMGSTQVALQ